MPAIEERARTQRIQAREESKSLPLALRYREAAELIGVPVRQIHNLANAGLLKRVRIGKRCTRITTASAIELIGE